MPTSLPDQHSSSAWEPEGGTPAPRTSVDGESWAPRPLIRGRGPLTLLRSVRGYNGRRKCPRVGKEVELSSVSSGAADEKTQGAHRHSC